METSDRNSIIRRIAEVEEQIARLQEQQGKAEATLRSLRKQLELDNAETTNNKKQADQAHSSTAENLTPSE